MSTSYAQATINADRGQHSFKLSLQAFCQKRGCGAIAARGKKLKHQYANLFAQIESAYGVPPGPLLAIWGMETGFGAVSGHQNMLSAVATLAYDCRRTEYFTDQLNAALTLVDRGTFSAGTIGSMHGEVGMTQFMPKTVLQYGVGSLDSAQGALMSTANYLKGHGWSRGGGYGPGESNYGALAGMERGQRLPAGHRQGRRGDRRRAVSRRALHECESRPFSGRLFLRIQGFGDFFLLPLREKVAAKGPDARFVP